MSIVLTAFLVNGLMSPLSLRIERQVWELKVIFFSFLVCFLIDFIFAFEPLIMFSFCKLDFAYVHSEGEESDADM